MEDPLRGTSAYENLVGRSTDQVYAKHSVYALLHYRLLGYLVAGQQPDSSAPCTTPCPATYTEQELINNEFEPSDGTIGEELE